MSALSMNEVVHKVRPAQPFRLERSTSFLCSFPATIGEQVAEPNRLVRAWRFGDHTVAADVSQQEDGDLAVRFVSESELSPEVAAAALDRVSFYLSVNDDVQRLIDIAQDDPHFRRVLEQGSGYHQVKIPSPIEHLCWAILAQRVPMPVAKKMKSALVERFNNHINVDGQLLHAFPSPEQLAELSEHELLELVQNPRKAKYLFGSIRGFSSVDEEFLRSGDFDEVESFLLGLPGIGPWSASFLMIRGLGRMERMPTDPEALRAASRAYGHPVDAEEFDRLAEPYGDLRGYWGHYLRAFA